MKERAKDGDDYGLPESITKKIELQSYAELEAERGEYWELPFKARPRKKTAPKAKKPKGKAP